MATIWKFDIPFEDEFTLEMPRGAEILHVGQQLNLGRMLARVVPERAKVLRRFRLHGTGHTIDLDGGHVGSFLVNDGQLVFHLFEVDPQ